MKPLLPVIALVALTAACGSSETGKAADGANTVKVADALCRPTPNGRDMTACYMTLTASADDRLMSIAAPDATSAKVHEMKTENGVMSMAEITGGLPLPAGKATALAPNGDHIMLMGLSRPLAEGDVVSLTLGFQRAAPVAVQARVAQPALPGAH